MAVMTSARLRDSLLCTFFTMMLGLVLTGQDSHDKPSSGLLKGMVQESWQHYRNWWQAGPGQPAWIYGGTGAVLSLAVAPQDASWQSELSRARSPFRNHLATGVEPLGNPYWVLPLSGLVYTGTAFWGNAESRRVAGNAFRSLVATAAVTVLLKQMTGRGRPEDHPGQPYRFRGPGLSGDFDSFPSGHTALAFGLASSLSHSWGDRWYVALPLYGAAALVGWQRIYDDRHWPSDVLAGATVGTLVGRGLGQVSDSFQLSATPLFTGDLGLALVWKLD